MTRKMRFTGILFVMALLYCSLAAADALNIVHTPLDCIVQNTFPVLDSAIDPAPNVTGSKIYFKATGTSDWYYVQMKSTGGGAWQGTLPKPAPALQGIDYYLTAMDFQSAQNRTNEYHPIVSTKTYCENQSMTVAESADTDKIVLVIGLVRAGQEIIPEGFLSEGITQVIMPDGTVQSVSEALSASAGTASAGAASGGGSNALWWVLGGVAVAGGAAYAYTELDDDDEDGDITEETLVGSWRVTEQSRSESVWYMRTTLNSNFSFSFTEYIYGSPQTGSGSWSYNESSRYFIWTVTNGGGMEGTISGEIDDFNVDGYWSSGASAYFHWVRQ